MSKHLKLGLGHNEKLLTIVKDCLAYAPNACLGDCSCENSSQRASAPYINTVTQFTS